MRHIIPSRKKGDAYTAKDQRLVASAINALTKGEPMTVTDHGKTPQIFPFEPIFFYKDGELCVKISETRKGGNLNEKGRVEWRVPIFEGEPIINPDPADGSWQEPYKVVSVGEWAVFLVDGVSQTVPLEIIVQEASTPAPEEKPPWKNVYKLAAFDVYDDAGLMLYRDLKSAHTPSMLDNPSPFPPFFPKIWYSPNTAGAGEEDNSGFRALFTPAQVLHYKDGTAIDVTINGGAMDTDEGQVVADGDEFWVEVQTDDMGTPDEADLKKTTDETTIQFEEPFASSGTDGYYWFKVCTFHEDSDGFLSPKMHWSGNIPWNPRPWSNVGNAEEVIKEFSGGVYKARSLSSAGVDPGASETFSGDSKVYDVYVKPQEDGDVIKFSGKVELPDAGDGDTSVMQAYVIDGHKIATHNDGSLNAQDTDINETVTSIAVYGGNTQPLSSDYFSYIDEKGDETQVFFPDAGGLPAGSAGDMLYHNGVDWVVLASPAAPGTDTVNILTHSGAAPVWVNKAIEEIDVCVSGSPTTWDIIKM
jgi:hypothetical protein